MALARLDLANGGHPVASALGQFLLGQVQHAAAPEPLAERDVIIHGCSHHLSLRQEAL